MAPRMTHQAHQLPKIPDPPATSMSRTSGPLRSPKDIKLPPSPTDFEKETTITPTRPPNPERFETYPSTTPLPLRPRADSPPRSQSSSHTSTSAIIPPLMQRAHSSPGVDSAGRLVTPPLNVLRRPSSPLTGGRRRSPLRSAMEDAYPVSWSGLSIEPNIPEHEELAISSPVFDHDMPHTSPVPSYNNTFPRSRRRPASPLHQSASAPSLYARASSPSRSGSGNRSPSLLTTQRYANEPYPGFSFSSASSMPSTPTSFRSRSPSISSLDTIEDIPDAEAAEEEEDSKQKPEDSDGELRRRSSLELRANSLRSNRERKRWSVCGAERRADFSLEPIEE